MAFELKSNAFESGKDIPGQYTCDGQDLSPPLQWQNPPTDAKSFVLIVDDPDVPLGAWIHWVVYDIPAEVHELSEGIPKSETLADGTKQGMTDFRRLGYGGPCPPAGKAHHYHFKLYALNAMLDSPVKQTKAQLLQVMTGHILGEARLTGLYQRKK